MAKRIFFQFVLVFALLLQTQVLRAQERVYVSTDKELYLAGESIWCSVFCIDESTSKYSQFSSVAYLEFHSKRGMEALIKVAMADGRGCGRLQVPFSFATGNCTIVAYTSKDGGDSKGEFNGKTVTVFNTLSSDKVKDGVEVVEKGEPVMAPEHKPVEDSGAISIEVGEQGNGAVPVKIRNAGGDGASMSVSVYHIDGIEDIIGKRGYDNTSLLERKGDFEVTGIEEYAGEMIRTRVFRDGKPLRGNDAEGVYMYMSAMGNTDDTYIANVDSLGYATYYTNNISGKRDLLFDVVTNVRQTAKIGSGTGSGNGFRVEKVEGEMEEPLRKRSMRMQVGRRFEQDTLFNLMPMRSNDFFGAVEPIVYNLDDYTRFPLMKEVISEYVSNLRVRKVEGEERLLVLWQETEGAYTVSRQYALALLDGVPVRDHSKIINMDPLLVKQIIIYPRRYLLNYFMFDGIVKFNTYKGDMGGMKLGEDVNILSHDGPQYPLAFMGDRIPGNGRYPNYNSTIYWNPVVDMDKDGVYEFNCPLPDYKGNFRIVVEGIDGAGNGIYKEAVVSFE